MDNDFDRNVDIEENSPFQEGIISDIYERPDTSYIQEPQELKDLIDTTKLIQKFLPKRLDIDKILDIIKRKVLKGTHLPLTIKKFKQVILVVTASKTYICSCLKINYPAKIIRKESQDTSRKLWSITFLDI